MNLLNNNWNLTTKVAVVTGASRGIGKSIAIALANAGCNVIINYCNNDQSAYETKQIIESLGVQCECVKKDISTVNGVSELLEISEEVFKKVDIWVNNAGVYFPKLLLQTSETDWNTIIDTNLKGCFFATKLVIKDMIRKKIEGCIINVSSYSAIEPEKYGAVYAASKAGVLALTSVAAKEYGPHGIRVNAILPGLVDTDMNKSALSKASKEVTPVVNYVDAEDIGDFCCFLASDKATYLTGKKFNIINN